jgi:hypothetical protein
MSKRMRILIGFGVLVVACGAYMALFGVQTFYIWESRRMARKEPVVWTTPVALSDLSASQVAGKRLSYFGYEFDVPWSDIDQDKTKVVGNNIAIIVFRSGNVFSFWADTPKGLISTMSGKIDVRSFGLLVGVEAAQSDYAFTRAILETTPGKFTLLMPRRQAMQQGTLFLMKRIILRPGSEAGVFSLKTKEFKGFQYGRPENSSTRLSVELFRSDGHLDIYFGQKLNGSVAISQSDVNHVVQSVHKVGVQESSSLD